VYTYPVTLATVDQTSSTWFKGYTKKYYYDKGAIFKKNHPVLMYFLIPFYAFRIKSKQVSFIERIKLGFKGAKGYLKNSPYVE
jgi:hypothetical protein